VTPCPHASDARNCWECRPRPLVFDAGPLEDSLPAADGELDPMRVAAWAMAKHSNKDEAGVCRDCGRIVVCGMCAACATCRRVVCGICLNERHDRGRSGCAYRHSKDSKEARTR